MKKNNKRVRATLGPKILTNVGRYFTNDLGVIAAELLRNCRRAGATEVKISIAATSNEVTVTDNGGGLSLEAVGTLLTFGGSANNAVVEFDETPAGMGFFALAMRGARVRSADWQMTVPPEAFTGLVEVTVVSGLPPIAGMEVTFPADLDRGREREDAELAFLEAAKFMPFEVTIDGQQVRRRLLIDWLSLNGAPGSTSGISVASAAVGDCIVVVARYEDGGERWEGRGPPVGEDDDDWLAVYVDIFGKVLKVPADLVTHYGPVLAEPAEGPLLLFPEPHVVRWPVFPGYFVAIEAVGQTTLKARLPDRGELVRTPELGAVVETIVGLVTRLAADAKRNSVAANGWPRLVAAHDGIDIPTSQARAFTSSRNLRRGFGLDSSPTPHARQSTLGIVAEGGDVIYRFAELPADDDLLQAVEPEPALEQALLRASGSPRLLVCHGGAIDGIERIVGASVVTGSTRIGLDVGGGAPVPRQAHWPRGIVVTDDLRLELASSTGRHLQLALEFIVGAARDDRGMPSVLARRSASLGDIVRECAADHQTDTPFARGERELRSQLTTALRSPAQMAAELVRDALVDAGLAGVGDGLEIATMNAALNEETGLTRLSVTMSDGSSATLDLDPDATVWDD